MECAFIHRLPTAPWRSYISALLLSRKLEILALGISFAVIGCSSGGGGGSSTSGFVGLFTSDNLNLDITIETVIISADRRPEVTFTATDDAGALIPLSEFTDLRFILAVLERTSVGAPFEYLSYTTEIEDPDGTPNTGDEATQYGRNRVVTRPRTYR